MILKNSEKFTALKNLPGASESRGLTHIAGKDRKLSFTRILFMEGLHLCINKSNFEEPFPLRGLILENYITIKEHDKILNSMEEEDDFEQEEDLQTNFAIYFKKLIHDK